MTATTGSSFVKTTYDGLGRETLVQTGEVISGSQVIKSQVKTEYTACACSPVGKVLRVSRPFGPPPAQPAAWTTNAYDEYGRLHTVTAPDGQSLTHYAYSANTTTVTDPAGKWKITVTDAFGNIIRVVEPPAGAQPIPQPPAAPYTGMVLTVYEYNHFDQLKTVTMARDSGSQTRTFEYNDNGQLTRSTLPETKSTLPERGSAQYEYNQDGTLSKKTYADASRQERYTYTNAKLTKVQAYNLVNGAWQQAGEKNFYYDTNPFTPGLSINTQGRLAASKDTGSGADVTWMYTYTPGAWSLRG